MSIIKQDYGELGGGDINFGEPLTFGTNYVVDVSAPANSYILYSSFSAKKATSYTAVGDVTISGNGIEVIEDTANDTTSNWGEWYLKTRQIIVYVPTAQTVKFTGINGTGNVYSGVRPIITIITK